MSAYVLPDVERAMVDLLDTLTPSPVTVGAALPASWAHETSPIHLLVADDGTNLEHHRLTGRATIRITAWAHRTTDAKTQARQAQARLLAHDGTGTIRAVTPGVGPIPTRDPQSGAELAWITVIVTVRPSPLT